MESLPFDDHFQKHFVNHLLRDSDFLGQVVDDIDPDIFLDDTLRRVVRLVKDFWPETKGAPGTLAFRVLSSWKEKSLISSATYETMNSFIDELFTLDLQNKSFLLKEFGRFVRKQTFKAKLPSVLDYVKADDFDAAEAVLGQIFATKSVSKQDLGRELTLDPTARIERRLTEDVDRLWTLIPELDRRIPGLKGGEMGVWLSQRSSAGKSAALQLIARSSAYQGKKTVIYTFEMSEEAYEDRLDQCIAGLTRDMLLDYSRIHRMLSSMCRQGGRIWIKQFPTNGATIQDMRRHKAILENVHGFVPDVIIVDYLDLVACEAESLYAEGKKLYSDFRGWLVEENLVGWTGSQSRRDGAESTFTDMHQTGGSIAKAEIADVILSINRTAEEEKLGRTTLYVAKNRNGAARYPITINTDFSKMAFWRRSDDE